MIKIADRKNAVLWDTFAEASNNLRMDTALRTNGVRKSLDVRDSIIEGLMRVVVLYGGAVDEVLKGIEDGTLTVEDAKRILTEAEIEVGEVEKIIEQANSD